MDSREKKDDFNPVLPGVLKNASEIILQIDKKGTIRTLFDENFEGNDLVGKDLPGLLGYEEATKLTDAFKVALNKGQFEGKFEYGQGIPGHIMIKLLKLNDNGIMCLLRDIPSVDVDHVSPFGSQEFKNLVEKITEVIYELDEQGIVRYVSPSVIQLLGYTQDEVIGQDMKLFLHKTEVLFETRRSYLLEHKEMSGELKVPTKSGNEIWVRFSSAAVMSGERLIGSVGTLLDITEQKLAEFAIKESEGRYKLLAENISDVIWVYNLTKDKFIYMSPSVYKFRGITPEEAIVKKIDADLSPESSEKVRKSINEAIKGLKTSSRIQKTFLYEVQIRKADGSMMWIEVSSNIHVAENGDVEVLGVSRDIEERKRAELQLQKITSQLKSSEELFFSVFNQSPVPMILSDPDTKTITDINRQLGSVLGIERESFVGKEFINLGLVIHDNKVEELGRMITQDIPIRDFEVLVSTPNGEVHSFQLTVEKIRLKNKFYLLTSAVDISERKKNEARVSKMLDQEKLIAELSQILNQPGNIEEHIDKAMGMVGKHADVGRVFIFEESDNKLFISNTFEWCSDGIQSLKGMHQKIPYDKIPSWEKLLSEYGLVKAQDVRELPEDLFTQFDKQGLKSLLGYRLKVDDRTIGFIGFGEYRKPRNWVHDETELLRTISGIIANALQRKIIVEKLEYSNLRLQLAIESANEGLWDWNKETDEVYTNDKCYKILGYEKDELNLDATSLWRHVHPDDRNKIKEATEKHFSGQTDIFKVIYRIRAKDNSWRWIMDHGKVVKKDANNNPLRFIGTRLDISEQMETEVKLHQLVETQDKLFSIIAHDLRGPIGSFNQGIELLTSGMITDEKLTKRLLEELGKTSQTTFRLLENLLNWSVTKSNTIKIEPEPLRLKQVIEENLKLLAAYTLQKSINVTVDADDQIMAYADRDSVNLILRNLLNNAVKFTPNQGTVKVSATDIGRLIELQVADTGVGMSNERLNNLFKLNSYNTSLGTNKEKGSGIGLVLCKDVVERNGGSIIAESTPGMGSRFRVTLPRYS